MKATGIVRRIDDLGRIVIPKELRRVMEAREGDPIELFIEGGSVILRRYLPDSGIGERAIQSVSAERIRQDAKWGEQNHDPQYWMGILGEEFGELCQAVNETVFNNGPVEREKGGYANMRTEAVQVAAVAVAFVELLDRRYGGAEHVS
jgi:AbrB family looped-hinge helix DNA binding protein